MNPEDPSGAEEFRSRFFRIEEELKRVMAGQDDLIRKTLMAMVAGGHVLLEGAPGLGKTLLVRSLAGVFDLRFQRVQFTPDLMPADLLGTNILVEEPGAHPKFEFSPGPVFCNLLLADEINRATPKTQSALLEAMQERQGTIGTTTYKLPDPFLVLATQNPIEQEGTYQLPEAQLDRFMLKVHVGYPSKDEERKILDAMATSAPQLNVREVISADEIIRARATVNAVYVDDRIKDYIVDIVRATREPAAYKLKLEGMIRYGASPRATIYLALAAYNATQGLWPKAGEIAFQVLAGAVAAGGIYGGATLGGPE
ncbi:MAG: AAA family ATPase, partial [Terrimicrobiaceae bacterium]|nr:AAA family ATPase [Terrimicrobiaceae bacterium]